MSNLERVPKYDDPRFEAEKRKWMQEVLDALGGDLQRHYGDPASKLAVCCEQDLDPELYKMLKGIDADDVVLLKEAMSILKGHKLKHDASEVGKDLEHMLADYRSARSIGKILKMVWIAIAGILTATFAIIKGLPDFLDLLRGWLK